MSTNPNDGFVGQEPTANPSQPFATPQPQPQPAHPPAVLSPHAAVLLAQSLLGRQTTPAAQPVIPAVVVPNLTPEQAQTLAAFNIQLSQLSNYSDSNSGLASPTVAPTQPTVAANPVAFQTASPTQQSAVSPSYTALPPAASSGGFQTAHPTMQVQPSPSSPVASPSTFQTATPGLQQPQAAPHRSPSPPPHVQAQPVAQSPAATLASLGMGGLSSPSLSTTGLVGGITKSPVADKKAKKEQKPTKAASSASLSKPKKKDSSMTLTRIDRGPLPTPPGDPLIVRQVQSSPQLTAASAPTQQPNELPSDPNESEQDARRRQIAYEILDTETKYTSYLRLLCQLAIVPLRKKQILTEAEIRSVFANIESLSGFHEIFLKQVEAKVRTWSATTLIGDVFLKFAATFSLYTEFINNFEKSDKAVKKLLKKHKAMASVEAELMAHPQVRKLDFQSFLIMPVQRLPRYVLLLEELLRKTPATHPDYSNISSAIERVKVVSQQVNSKKAQSELNQRFFDIATTLTGIDGQSLLKPSRTYVMETEGVFLTTKGLITQTLVQLADSILIITKGAGKSAPSAFSGILNLKCVRMQPMTAMQVKLNIKSSLAKTTNVDLTKASPHWIQLLYLDQEYLFSVASEAHQTAFISAFESAKLNVQSRYWKKIDTPTAPEPRSNHTFIHLPATKQFLVFGGQGDRAKFLGDVWLFDIEKKVWSQPTVTGVQLPTLSEHCTVLIDNKLYIYGGHNTGVYSEVLYRIDLATMNVSTVEQKGTIPPVRSHATCTVVGTKFYTFGGSQYAGIGGTKFYDDMHCFDTETSTWSPVEPATASKPTARIDHACIAYNNKFYLFGGSNKDKVSLNDLWVWDFLSNTWTQDVGVCGFVPAPRSSTAYLTWEQFLLVSGGDGNNTTFDDLYLLNLETTVWTRIDTQVPLVPRLAGFAELVTEKEIQQEGGAKLFSRKLVLYIHGGRVLRSDDSRGASGDLVSVEIHDKWIEQARLAADSTMSERALEHVAAKQSKLQALNDKFMAFNISNRNSAAKFSFVKRVRTDPSSQWDTSSGTVSLGEQLGSGTYTEVYKAIQTSTQIEAVAKILQLRPDVEAETQRLFTDFGVLKRCNHPSLCNQYNITQVDPQTIWILSEYCKGGSIRDLIRLTGKTLNERQIASVCAQALSGLSYLHSLSLIHRDLKCSNILATDEGKVKLGDFMLQEYVGAMSANHFREDPTNIPPEISSGQPYTNLSDIYCLGLAVVEMCENTPPFKQLQKPKKFSAELLDFLNQCFLPPSKRPDVPKLLLHPFLAQANPFALAELVEASKKAKPRQKTLQRNLTQSTVTTTSSANLNATPVATQPVVAPTPVAAPVATPVAIAAPTPVVATPVAPQPVVSPPPGDIVPSASSSPALLPGQSGPGSATAVGNSLRRMDQPLRELVKQMLAGEMAALKQHYDAQIQALQDKVAHLETEVASLRGHK